MYASNGQENFYLAGHQVATVDITAAGDCFAGGLIGGFASHGNGLATVGGVVGGGILGNVIAGDVDCEDQGQAYPIYVDSLNGDVGRPYEWRRGPNHGTFTSTREFRRGGQICREFTTTSWRRGDSHTRTGVACRDMRGNSWRFD